MSQSKHWLLEIPLINGIVLSLLIIHTVGLPLLGSLFHYPNFFKETELFKLLLVCTSIGAVIVCFVSIIIITIISSTETHYVAETTIYPSLIINLIMIFILLDASAIGIYFWKSEFPPIKYFVGLALILAFVIPTLKNINKKLKKQ